MKLNHTPSYLGVVSTDPKDGRKKSGVYAIINQAGGNMYVGASKGVTSRWVRHQTLLRNNKHHSRHLQNAWDKYGPQRFQFVILAFCGVDDLADTEQYYINTLRPVYNVIKIVGAIPSSKTRNAGRKHSEETKQKMRGPRPNISGKNNPMYGVHLNGELNPMWGKKKPETSEFNRRAKKGKTYEEMYGDERGKLMRERRRQENLERYGRLDA